jgi:hypothetical protein
MLNILNLHLVASGSRINHHGWIHPYPNPYPQHTIKTTELYLDSDVAWAREEFERADKVLRFKPAKPVLNEK